jgi:hypothetical protein
MIAVGLEMKGVERLIQHQNPSLFPLNGPRKEFEVGASP